MKQKQQIIVLVVLVAVAVLVWGFELHSRTTNTVTTSFIQDYKPLGEDNPQIRWGELKRAQETEYKSNGRNPFSPIAPPSPEDLKKANTTPKSRISRRLRLLPHRRPRQHKCRRISNFLVTAQFQTEPLAAHSSPTAKTFSS